MQISKQQCSINISKHAHRQTRRHRSLGTMSKTGQLLTNLVYWICLITVVCEHQKLLMRKGLTPKKSHPIGLTAAVHLLQAARIRCHKREHSGRPECTALALVLCDHEMVLQDWGMANLQRSRAISIPLKVVLLFTAQGPWGGRGDDANALSALSLHCFTHTDTDLKLLRTEKKTELTVMFSHQRCAATCPEAGYADTHIS